MLGLIASVSGNFTRPDESTTVSTLEHKEFRRQMPIAGGWAYFDHAAVAPLSGPAQAAIAKWLIEASHEGAANWPAWDRRVEQCRTLAARLVGASPDEIALLSNTTHGIGLVAEGYPWQPGDNVVTLADEFPSNIYPWLNLQSRGVETRQIATLAGRIDWEAFSGAIDSQTRIVAISAVGYSSGCRHDVARVVELAHSRGALVMLDAIQAVGAIEIDVEPLGVDFLAADGHKWMLGPEGAAIFYCRAEHLNRLRPLGVGWHSVKNRDFKQIDFQLRDTATRYEGGSMNTVGLIGLAASLEMLFQLNGESIERHLLAVTDHLCAELETAGAKICSPRATDTEKSGIVSFEFPGRDPMQLRAGCLTNQVHLSCRGGRLRAAPHAYCSKEDIARLIAALKD